MGQGAVAALMVAPAVILALVGLRRRWHTTGRQLDALLRLDDDGVDAGRLAPLPIDAQQRDRSETAQPPNARPREPVKGYLTLPAPRG